MLKGAEQSPGSSSPLPFVPVTQNGRATVLLGSEQSHHDAPEIVVSPQQPALRSGSPQDGVRAALHMQQRLQQVAAGTAGVPTPLLGPGAHWSSSTEGTSVTGSCSVL